MTGICTSTQWQKALDDDDGHAESNALWEHIQEARKKYKQPNWITEAATTTTTKKKETHHNIHQQRTILATVEHEFSVCNHYQIVEYEISDVVASKIADLTSHIPYSDYVYIYFLFQ